jgi:hypothetical protein
MAEQYITCPHCQKKIPLTKALTKQIEDRISAEYEAEQKSREKELTSEFKAQLAAAKRQAEKKAKDDYGLEIGDLRQQVADQEAKLEEGRKQELDLRKRQRELQEKEKTVELDVTRRIDDERKKIETETSDRLAEEHRAKDVEKDQQLQDLRRQIEDLKRKAEQGSQQSQGEAVEIELEQPVAKGARGADVVQHVHSSSGHLCGTIIWESKNTKAWSDSWLEKLKDDQRAIRAEVAALASIALPRDVRHFAQVEGVWVTDFSTVVAVAGALRTMLTQVAMTRLAAEGKSDKMEVLYSYLSGSEFKQRVEAIAEPFVDMRDDLEREKRAAQTSWAKRDKQLERVLQNVAGMYGDMQGIIGKSLPRIDYLELPAPKLDADADADS